MSDQDTGSAPPMTSQLTVQLAHFEVRVIAVDHPTERRRWDGGPMASDEAFEALEVAVNAFCAVLEARGFEIGRTGYGVSATAPNCQGDCRNPNCPEVPDAA